MPPVVPPPFLFRYSFPVRYVADLPRGGKRLLDLPEECALPHVAALDGAARVGEVRLAWNTRGLGVSVRVAGRSQALRCDAMLPAESDGLQIWVDTRNTQSIHRASRFCHHFCLLPAGGGAKGRDPLAVQLPIARAREEAPLAAPGAAAARSDVTATGYALEAWLPAEVLHGFDPDATPRIGFYYYLRDAERGEQFLTVGHEFPFSWDPSVWSTLELVRR